MCVAIHNLCFDSDSGWMHHFTLILKRAPVGSIPDIAFGMEVIVNQRAAGAAAKRARQQAAENCPAQPVRARRGIVADVVRV